MADRFHNQTKNYKVTVEVTYRIEIPVKGKDEEEAIEAFEKTLMKHDDYEIVNRSTKRTVAIEGIKETYE